MATMNISLPDPMRDWVESQIESGQYANNSDYVRDRIRKDQQKAQKLIALQEAIDKGLASGDAGELNMSAIIQEAKHRAGTDA